MSIKAILFDLDDTLYQERTYVESGFAAVAVHLAQRFGFSPEAVLAEMIQLLEREGRGRIFDRVLTSRGRYTLDLVQECVALYRGHAPQIRLEPTSRTVLGQLRRWGLKLGVLTDGLLVMQQQKVLALGLAELVDATVYTDDLGPSCHKPHPAGFHCLLERVRAQPAEVLFVGNDPVKDVAGAQAVGIEAVHLLAAAEPMPGAQYTIRRLDELLPLVAGRLAASSSGKGSLA